MASVEKAKVAECFEEGTFSIHFRRTLTPAELQSYEDLKSLMSPIKLDNLDDEIHWALDKSRNFTTKSLYRFMLDGGIRSRISGKSGSAKPQKIKIFLWQLFNDRLQTATNLKNEVEGQGVLLPLHQKKM